MGTLTGSAISSTYKSLIFTDKTGTGIGDIWYTLDNGDDQKLTTLTTALTFTGKITATAGIELDNSLIFDASGNEGIKVTATGSAVNYLDVKNSATGNAVTLDVDGSDSNIGLTLDGKGTGVVTSTPQFVATAGVKLGNDIIYNSEGTQSLTLDAGERLTIAGNLIVSGGDASIVAANTENAVLRLAADNSDDAGDDWSLTAQASGLLAIGNDIASAGTAVTHLEITPNSTVANSMVDVKGKLKIGGNLIETSNGSDVISFTAGGNVTLLGTLATGGSITMAAATDIIWDTSLDILLTTGSVSYLSFDESNTRITSNADVEMSVAGGLTQSPIVQTAATKTLDKYDSGHIVAVDTTSNDVAVTLPAAQDGLNFKFMITKKGSYDLEIISPSATNYFYGGVVHLDTDSGSGGDEVVSVVSDYDSNDYLTLLLADVGTVVELVCNGTLWFVSGTVNSTTAPTFGDASGL